MTGYGGVSGGNDGSMQNLYSTSQQQPRSSGGGAARRRKRLVMLLVMSFIAWAAVTVWDQTALIKAKQQQLQVLERKLEETRAVNERLKLEITRLNDDEYIEQKAKKDFQMVVPGETLYIAPDPQDE